MKFTFELTKQDYLDFNMFTVKNYKFYKTQMKLFRGIFTIIPIGTGLVNLLLNGEKRIGVIVALLIVMTLISILFWCGFPKFYDALMLRNAKKILFREGENHVLGKRTLFFEEDKIQTVTALSGGAMLAAIKLRFSNIKVYMKRYMITGGY